MGDYLGSVALPSMKLRQKKLCQVRLQPRAAPVYNDSSNFGVRMLEKLGWSEGKGLGKREDGMSAPILPKIKQDIEGFGYAGEKDNHWTQHDQDFNQLLKSLNGEEATAENEVNLIKMKSLEEKSKNSRARVHYKKFTRGKDLSRASEKDLANIFGKKTLYEVKNQTVIADVDAENVQEYEQDDESSVLGLTTIKASMSLQDYFKSKMQEKIHQAKANDAIKQEVNEAPSNKKSKRNIELDETMVELDNKAALSMSKKQKTMIHDERNNIVAADELEQEAPRMKKSKKEKRSKTGQEELSVHATETNNNKSKTEKLQQLEQDQQVKFETSKEQPAKKKSNKNKKTCFDEEHDWTSQTDQQTEEMNAKNEKMQQLEQNPQVKFETSAEQPAKKKSKKNKQKCFDEELDSKSQPDQQTKEKNAPSSEEMLPNSSVVESDASIKKKRKKTEEKEVAQDVEVDEITCRVKVSVLKQLDESGFPGSNFADIVGYGLSQEVKLIKRESHRKKNLEKHQFIRQKQTTFQRKRQMLKKVSAFKRI